MMRPTPTEIRVPFQVGPSGGIDFTMDPVVQAMQHVMSAVLTASAERVMRPGYGTEVYSSLFEADDPGVATGLVAAMQAAIRGYVPTVVVHSIKLVDDTAGDGLMQFYISFALVGRESETHEATISVGGSVFEQTYSQGT